MQVIPALGRRTFSSTARQSARAILQGERGRWWKTEGAVASVAVPASPFARVVDATDIMVTNVQTLAKNPFAEQVAMQAPNRKETWSASQRPRGDAIRGARFEQTDLALQPFAPSAEEMIAEEPIRVVHGNRAVCDGGGGSLGHPRVFIPLDKPGEIFPCGYCGIRFKSDGSHHH